MNRILRIGTRESQLALWQATQVREHLVAAGFAVELVPIRSEGDIDLHTPLYAMGVQGVFTRSLDSALLNDRIDLAVHSMKDVPVQLPAGIVQAAVLERGPVHDVFIPHPGETDINRIFQSATDGQTSQPATIATSSVRRIAQWLHRYPHHRIENLRGNVNTRLRKLSESDWQGAVFAAAGLARIDLLPANHVVLDWMLPAPAQGAILVVCRETDTYCRSACSSLNDSSTALCTKVERDFLKALLGGCSTPISALATIDNGYLQFSGNILSPDGKQIAAIKMNEPRHQSSDLGSRAAAQLLENGGREILEIVRNASR